MQPNSEFLTPEECLEVDQALLTAKDKFSARVAIYSLRSLKQMAQTSGQTIANLEPTQIAAWIEQDETLQGGLDREFRNFFSKLVIASINPLNQIAAANGSSVENLSVRQVVAWFEAKAKAELRSQT